jgi:altronate hydrolase
VLRSFSNTAAYDIDLNARGSMDGSASMAQIGQAIFERLIEVASSAPTASEQLGHQEFVPWRIGPVLSL